MKFLYHRAGDDVFALAASERNALSEGGTDAGMVGTVDCMDGGINGVMDKGMDGGMVGTDGGPDDGPDDGMDCTDGGTDDMGTDGGMDDTDDVDWRDGGSRARGLGAGGSGSST